MLSKTAMAGTRRSLSMLTMTQELPGLPPTTLTPSTHSPPTTSTLPSNLTLITHPTTLSSATVTLTYPIGTSTGAPGAAAAMKHMSFKTSAAGSTIANLRAIENAGCTNFSSVTRDTLTLGYTGSPNAITALLPTLDLSTVTGTVWDVKDAIDAAKIDQEICKTTPERSIEDQLFAAAYGEKSGTGRSAYGAASGDDVATFHKLLGANGAVLSATGISDHAAFASAVTSAFSGYAGAGPGTADKYTGGECRINAVSEQAHVAIAFHGGAVGDAIAALFSLTGGAPVAAFKSGGLVGVYGSGAAETADAMCKTLSANVSSALKADESLLKRAIAKAKADAVFNASASSRAAAEASAWAAMNSGFVGEAATIAAYDKLTVADVKKGLEAAVAGGVSVASVGDLSRVGYAKEFKF